MPQLASVRSNIIMDYGDMIRANILTNHCHNYGLPKQQSYIKIEGSKGAIKINFGALINYPRGAADSFEYLVRDSVPERHEPDQRFRTRGPIHRVAWSMDTLAGARLDALLPR